MAVPEKQLANKRRPKSRIPRFQSIEEEAEWWDTHDLTEFEDELEVVEDVYFIPTRGGPKKRITVSLDPETYAALTAEAEKNGVRPSALIWLWVAQHVRGGPKTPASPKGAPGH